MKFRIANSTKQDLDNIFILYDEAIAYQQLKFNKHWPLFNRASIENEINEGRHFKIVTADSIAGVFSLTYNDAEIWGAKDSDGAVYLHRIVTGNSFHGNNLVGMIIEWTKQLAAAKHIAYIRLDCFADNQSLVDHYIKCGFTFLGSVLVKETESTPKHYIGNPLALLEMKA